MFIKIYIFIIQFFQIILLLIGFCYLLTFIKVRTFFIYNNNYLTDEEVLKELKLDNDSSFLLTNTAFEKNIIRKSKLIKNVKLHKTLYLEIKVDIEEYKLLFYYEKKKKTII